MNINIIINIVLKYWYIFIVLIFFLMPNNFIIDYFNPEYCILNTNDNIDSISAHGFELSNTDSNSNQICFRSKNQDKVQELFLDINDKQMSNELEMDKLRESNKQKTIDKLLEPEYFYPILIVLLILVYLFFNKTTKNNQYRY